MSKEIKQALFDGVKELGRVILLAIIPVAISSLENEGSIDLRSIYLVVAIAVLRAIDRGLHEYGKSIESEAFSKGITQF